MRDQLLGMHPGETWTPDCSEIARFDSQGESVDQSLFRGQLRLATTAVLLCSSYWAKLDRCTFYMRMMLPTRHHGQAMRVINNSAELHSSEKISQGASPPLIALAWKGVLWHHTSTANPRRFVISCWSSPKQQRGCYTHFTSIRGLSLLKAEARRSNLCVSKLLSTTACMPLLITT